MDAGHKDDEQKLWKRYMRTRDDVDRNRLVEFYLSLVESYVLVMARRKARRPDDLRGAAHVALIAAVERFEPEKGFTFDTFVRSRVTGAMIRELQNEHHLSRGHQKEFHEGEWERERAYVKTGKRPAASGFVPNRVELQQQTFGAQQCGETDAGDGLIAADIDSQIAGTPIGSASADEIGLVFLDVVAAVPLEDRAVLLLHFVEGLDDDEIGSVIGKTGAEIGRQRREVLEELRSGTRPEKVGTLFDVVG